MILVVADTSPINYLVLVDAIEILPKLFTHVVIPAAVHAELMHLGAPEAVRRWAQSLPHWVEVKRPTSGWVAGALDAGEAEAIALAEELHAAAVLLDEIEAREEAVRLGLVVTGTIGLLERAAEKQLIEFKSTLKRLLLTNFRVSEDLIRNALAREERRRSRQT